MDTNCRIDSVDVDVDVDADAFEKQDLASLLPEPSYSECASHASSASDEGLGILYAATIVSVSLELLRQQLTLNLRGHSFVVDNNDIVNANSESSRSQVFVRWPNSICCREPVLNKFGHSTDSVTPATSIEALIDDITVDNVRETRNSVC